MTPGDPWRQHEEHLHEQWAEWQEFVTDYERKDMPKINEMIESKYLKQADIEDDTIVTVQGVKRDNIAREDAEPEFKWLLKFKEFPKPMVLNSTNIQLLARACDSEDTDDWVGKEVVLYVDESVSFGGKITGGLRIRKNKHAAVAKAGKVEDMENDIPFN